MTLQIEHCPWKVPLAVEDSRFTPLFAEHASLNIQVAPRHPGEARPTEPGHPPLLADLQTPFYGALGGSLGSGRAGFYRGFYLKGVGRTPLTSCWEPALAHGASPSTTVASASPIASGAHAPPGHLSASSAIRELVASIYLEEHGGADSIVPCQGVLFAELSPELAAYHAAHRPAAPELVPPVDRHLQAITVQDGGFARPSNLVWLLHHLAPATEATAGRHSLATFCRLLASSLDPTFAPTDGAALGAGDARELAVSPEQLVAALERTTLAALSRFRLWFQRGVWWGSFHNHFTIDGRFLDLETPALLGGPCLGRLSTAGGAARPVHSTVIGLEQLSFLAQTRAFAFEVRRVLRQLPRTFDRAERQLAEGLATALEERLLGPARLLGSREQALERVLAMVEDAFGTLSAVERTLVRSIVEAGYTSSVGQDGRDPTGRASATFTPVPGLPYLLTEAGHSWRPCAVALEAGRLLQPSDEQRRTARHFAELLADLDHTTELPALLDKLAALRASAEGAAPAAPDAAATASG